MSDREINSSYKSVKRRVKPGVLAMLALMPLFIFPFIANKNYREAFTYIISGLTATLILSLAGFLFAFVVALLVLKMRLLSFKKALISKYSILGLMLIAFAFSLLLIPKQTYTLVGKGVGMVVIPRKTPRSIYEMMLSGDYNKSGRSRNYRVVSTTKIALERLESSDYNFTAALIPKSQVPEGSNIIWEKTIRKTSVNDLFNIFLVLGLATLIISFVAWRTKVHPLSLFSEIFVDLARALPIVIFFWLGLRVVGKLPSFFHGHLTERRYLLAILALSMAHSANIAEIFRAVIQSLVPAGASSPEFRFAQLIKLRKLILPPLTNEFAAILRNTALVSSFGFSDIIRKSKEFGASELSYGPAYYTRLVIFIIIVWLGSSIFKAYETKDMS